MNKRWIIGCFCCLLASSCSNSHLNSSTAIGGNQDERGCLISAGYSWSQLKNQCIRPWEDTSISIPNPTNNTLAIYLLFSQDKSRVEVFGSPQSQPTSIILQKNVVGYTNALNQLKLKQQNQQWIWIQ